MPRTPTAPDAMRGRILLAAREELADVGPAALSLRSIARRLDVAVGGLYRYIDGRDALLTALIVDAYDGIGEAAERGRDQAGAEAVPARQWEGAWGGVRDWALGRPHEFALIYGTPVIGYRAPQDTVSAAERLLRVVAGIVVRDRRAVEARGRGAGSDPSPGPDLSEGLSDDLQQVRTWIRERLGEESGADDAGMLGVVRAWTELIGTIGFELHGHYVGSVAHGEEYFRHVVRSTARSLALSGS